MEIPQQNMSAGSRYLSRIGLIHRLPTEIIRPTGKWPPLILLSNSHFAEKLKNVGETDSSDQFYRCREGFSTNRWPHISSEWKVENPSTVLEGPSGRKAEWRKSFPRIVDRDKVLWQ
ncbi:Hypothetical protein NTJ_04133 [Nesidiocoris tenuis]|uniref:Uncharacterized protein n=1 Tax=Nesidiocoris tenuis TaxID=355587 RepID=A0ABN7AIZ3_9HEMI|nr:Hypothetical protein NTJ_04133 [Nesidiocoris tenuis]